MKVLHIGLVSHFTDKMLYQENVLVDMNAKAGHDVTFISDIGMYKDGTLTKTNECDVRLENGVRLIRVRYDRIINDFITGKIQKARFIPRYLNEIRPDAILYHGVCGYEMIDVAKYVKKYNIPFYMDSHENFKNTAMTPISKFAYKYIHGFFFRKARPYIRKVLYVGFPEKEYLQKMYHLKQSEMELFSLGGILLSEDSQKMYRKQIINDLGFPEDSIICAHSGKMVKGKRTEEVIKGFSSVRDARLRLIIYGSIPEEMKSTLVPLIEKDERISFLGWKTADEQNQILGATDLYLQPGTYSATAQVAICDGCVTLVNEGYKELFEDAAFYETDASGIENVLRMIIDEPNILVSMKEKGKIIAEKKLNYESLAKRYLV
ncbi:MAG: glycosyltransferase [Clostridia bacterium]|nr:glycosyltransferase [Clostridia bacterium]